ASRPASQKRINADRLSHLWPHENPPDSIGAEHALAFMGIEPSRLGEVDFSPAVVEFDYTYLVSADSTIRSAADADRPGIPVAVVNKHASTLTLSRGIKHAELIGADVPDAAFELLRTGKAHAFASAREPLG